MTSASRTILGTADADAIRARVHALDPDVAAVLEACAYLRAYAARCRHAVGDDARSAGLAEFAAALLD